MLDSADNASDDIRDEIKEILTAASPLGVEINEEEAIRWIPANSSADQAAASAQDPHSGVFGNRISLLDMVEPPGADWEEVLEQVRQRCAEIINEFFRARLFALPQIKDFIENMQKTA